MADDPPYYNPAWYQNVNQTEDRRTAASYYRNLTEDQQKMDSLRNDVDVMRTKLEELSTLMHMLNDKMEILWSAPGMPGFHDAKTAWTLDSEKE